MSMLHVIACILVAGPPPLYQPPADFYGAGGKHVTVIASATPTRVPANKVIFFSITVRGVEDAAAVTRPPLKELPEFAKRFEIGDGLDEPINETRPPVGQVSFLYLLRPRT